MDLLTQGLLGASLAHAGARREEQRAAAGAGFAAGLLADADALIGSGSDPLLTLELHRHFTHALAFVPAGALIAAGLLWPLWRRWLRFGRLYVYCLLGYALSGVLDACTSYGTRLWWPFDPEPVALAIVAIVDPVFTLSLAAGLGFGLARGRPAFARAGLAVAALYLGAGAWQHERAADAAWALATSRGHAPAEIVVKPTLANIVLWRSVYVHAGTLHADAIRAGLGAGIVVYPGESAPRVDADAATARALGVTAEDLARFAHLSGGYLARHPEHPERVGDARYAMLPGRLAPLWGITAGPDGLRLWTDRTFPPGDRQAWWTLLTGDSL